MEYIRCCGAFAIMTLIPPPSKVRVDYTGSVETDLLNDGIRSAGMLMQS